MLFEWDEEKAALNRRKHGISFSWAKRVFVDRHGIDRVDSREDYAEERWIKIGLLDGEIFVVVYTERGDRVRLISARRATRVEKDDYFRRRE